MFFIISNGILERYTGTDSHVMIPEEVTVIGERAFENHASLVSVTIPDRVTSIGSCAFSNCVNLRCVHINEGAALEAIGSYAFYACRKLEHFSMPDNVTHIGEKAFFRCTKLPDMSKLRKTYVFSTLVDADHAIECSYGREEALRILQEASRYRIKKEICDCDDHLQTRRITTQKIGIETILVEDGHFCGCVFGMGKLLVRNMGTGERLLIDTVCKGEQGDMWHEDLIYVSLC